MYIYIVNMNICETIRWPYITVLHTDICISTFLCMRTQQPRRYQPSRNHRCNTSWRLALLQNRPMHKSTIVNLKWVHKTMRSVSESDCRELLQSNRWMLRELKFLTDELLQSTWWTLGEIQLMIGDYRICFWHPLRFCTGRVTITCRPRLHTDKMWPCLYAAEGGMWL